MSIILLLISVFIYQTNLTDTDKKQILSQLFPGEQERTVLMSPRTDPTWLVEIPGIRFKKLEYGEEKDAAEYYELDIKVHHEYVELQISKGNYCKKTGSIYEFRKKDGKWTSKTTYGIESFGSVGSACTVCKLEPPHRAALKDPTKPKPCFLPAM